MIENVVPIVIAAKHQFEQEHHPLLKDLLACLKELMQVRETGRKTHRRSCMVFHLVSLLPFCKVNWLGG